MTWIDAVCRIDLQPPGEKPIRATGALVGDRFVLTAFHVVARTKTIPPVLYKCPIRLNFKKWSTTATILEDMWDAREDWVLLECSEKPPLTPIPLGELQSGEHDLDWETFGFPDANPEGQRMTGQIRNPTGTFQGMPAIQLYSIEAAAGTGAPMAGLSGAPCIVMNAVVGVLRSALLESGHTVAGTLFACPTGLFAERTAAYLPMPDPYRGLPGFPFRDLPPSPFRYLSPYTESEAELFFGRAAATRALYDGIVAPDAAPIILLFGQSGVGKSSLLEAGIAPRIGRSHAFRYERREKGKDLSVCLKGATEGNWKSLEGEENKSLVVVLDQVEQAWTQSFGDPMMEVGAFLDLLEEVFGDSVRRPKGRLILSLRKDWVPELEARLSERRLPFAKQFLERLDKPGIIEVVEGLQRSTRLIRQYNAQVEEGLGKQIAADLLSDHGSAVAPMLQIWMTRLWEAATMDEPGPRQLSMARYEELKKELPHLKDFLEKQVSSLPPEDRKHVLSGLVEDLLEWHTTSLGTSETRSKDELGAHYSHIGPSDREGLVQRLVERFVLTNPIERGVPDKNRTRLAHDTLGPLVSDRFHSSQKQGQRARRVLEARAPEWENGNVGEPLGETDLALVEAGRLGMRTWTADESRIAEVSSRRCQRRRRARNWRLATLAFLIIAVIVAGGWGWRQAAIARRERNAAAAKAFNLQIANLSKDMGTERAPLIAQDMAMLAVQSWRTYPTPEASQFLAQAISSTNHYVSRFQIWKKLAADDPKTNRLTLPQRLARDLQVVVSSNGLYASCWNDVGQRLIVYRLEIQRLEEFWSWEYKLDPPESKVTALAVSGDGLTVAVLNGLADKEEYVLRIMKAERDQKGRYVVREQMRRRYSEDPGMNLTFSSNGNYLWGPNLKASRAALIFHLKNPLMELAPQLPPGTISFEYMTVSEDETCLALLTHQGYKNTLPPFAISVFSLPGLVPIKTLTATFDPMVSRAVRFTPDGADLLAISGSKYRVINDWRSYVSKEEKEEEDEGVELDELGPSGLFDEGIITETLAFLSPNCLVTAGTMVMPLEVPGLFKEKRLPNVFVIRDWNTPTTGNRYAGIIWNAGPEWAVESSRAGIASLGVRKEDKLVVTSDSGGNITIWEPFLRYGDSQVPGSIFTEGLVIGESDDRILLAYYDEERSKAWLGRYKLRIASIHRWKTTTPEVNSLFTTQDCVGDEFPIISFSKNGQHVATVEARARQGGSQTDEIVCIYKILNGQMGEKKRLNTGKSGVGKLQVPDIVELAFSNDGSALVAVDSSGRALIWIMRDSTILVRSFHVAAKRVMECHVCFSQDDEVMLVSVGSDVQLWRGWQSVQPVCIGGVRTNSEGNNEVSVSALAVSADDQYLAAGTTKSAVTIWRNWKQGRPEVFQNIDVRVQKRTFNDNRVLSIAFHPEVEVLAILDKVRVHVFDLEQRASLASYEASIPCDRSTVLFSPDGRYVVCNGLYSYAFWLWRPEDMIGDASSSFLLNPPTEEVE